MNQVFFSYFSEKYFSSYFSGARNIVVESFSGAKIL